MYRTEFWTLWEKARVWCFERSASKHVYYLGWNRSPAQVGCMRQVLGPGTLRRPRGSWEGGSGWGIHVNPWLIQINIWQIPLQYCKVISLQLIKINDKKKDHGFFTTEAIPYVCTWGKHLNAFDMQRLPGLCFGKALLRKGTTLPPVAWFLDWFSISSSLHCLYLSVPGICLFNTLAVPWKALL